LVIKGGPQAASQTSFGVTVFSDMSNRVLLAFALAFVSGLGGMTSGLASMSMTDTLNTRRPEDDQIPPVVASWKDLQKHWELTAKHGFFYHWTLMEQFQQEFPQSRLPIWYVAGLVWMITFGLVGAVVLLTAR
jgi:hypothetical protein